MTLRHWRRGLTAAMLALSPGPSAAPLIASTAAPAAAPGEREAEVIAGLEALRAQDLRVATIFFRLATAGIDLCERRAPQTGMVLHDAGQYSADFRPIAVSHFGLGEGPSISAVAPGSPAAAAGLRADDALIAVDGAALTAAGAPADGRKASYDGLAQAVATLNQALVRGEAMLTIRRGGKSFDVALRPATGCASEVQLVPSDRMNAAADGRYVEVTSAIVDYAASDDELAVVIGHELAHNILGHRAKLDAQGVGTGLFSKFGKNAAKIRATEIEADRLGLMLMARAGYDLEAAPTFWRRFGKDHGLGIFADPTHPGWRKREAMLRAVIAEIEGRSAQREP